MKSTSKRVVVVGGVAGGASAAARLRRLDEYAEITILERGQDVSFANCGLPYHIGGEIPARDALAVQTPESLTQMLDLDVRNLHEAVSIDREVKSVRVRKLQDGSEFDLAYDYLILSPGASPIRPPLPGLDNPKVLTLRNLQDMDAIIEQSQTAKHITVIGAGFIGLEVAEQFKHLGKNVSLVELQDQVLPQLDPEMAQAIEKEMKANGVEVITGDGIQSVKEDVDELKAKLASGKTLETDLIVLSIGVKPDSQLAKAAGLDLGPRGHIIVNEFQQTSDPTVYAVGDAVETKDGVFEGRINIPLGGPANRQGRIAADHINNPGKTRPYPGSLGTSIVRAFKLAAGITGYSEKRLKMAGQKYSSVIVTDFNHASYYPGAVPLTIKVIWNPETGIILGAQAFGLEGVDKRLDVVATAIRGKLTIEDLEHLELSYAPPFGSAKDPVNIAGFAAKNAEDGYVKTVKQIPDIDGLQIVDVRPPAICKCEPLGDVTFCIPLGALRKNLDKLDKTKPVLTVCKMGKSSYMAARILTQHGFDVLSLEGGTTTLVR